MGGSSSTTKSIPTIDIDAPPLDDLDFVQGESKIEDLSKQSSGFLVLIFWGTWCKRSREAFPDLETLYRRLRKDPIEFLALSAEAKSTVTSYTEHGVHGFSFPCAINSSGSIAKALGVSTSPSAAVVLGGKVKWIGSIHDPEKLEKSLRTITFEQKHALRKEKNDGASKKIS